MKRKCIIGCLLAWAAIMAGCANLDSARHEYIMRGQILEVSDNEAYLCIGRKDGAEVGQEYTVYNFRKTMFRNQKSPQFTYLKEKTGTVKLIEIVDEHFAKAKILTGEAKRNYVVELSR
ncbi:MAG: hypothetical protein WA081_02240 [Desulfosalsimonadaceae bacterium]